MFIKRIKNISLVLSSYAIIRYTNRFIYVMHISLYIVIEEWKSSKYNFWLFYIFHNKIVKNIKKVTKTLNVYDVTKIIL